VPAARRLTPAKWVVIAVLLGGLVWYSLQVLKPPLPVTVQFHSDLRSSGFVFAFENRSDSALSFTATLQHAGQQQARRLTIQVPPHGSYELGSLQGWIGQSGDRIALSSRRYRTWTGAIP
jgi:hypothetical protein